jgi:hypothetical protein
MTAATARLDATATSLNSSIDSRTLSPEIHTIAVSRSVTRGPYGVAGCTGRQLYGTSSGPSGLAATAPPCTR